MKCSYHFDLFICKIREKNQTRAVTDVFNMFTNDMCLNISGYVLQ